MRDLTVDDLADEIREELRAMDIDLPPQAVRGLTKRFFKHVEQVMKDGRHNFQFWSKDIIQIFKHLDEKRLCDELANGETHMTYHYLIQKGKLSRNAAYHLKKRHFHRMRDK